MAIDTGLKIPPLDLNGDTRDWEPWPLGGGGGGGGAPPTDGVDADPVPEPTPPPATPPPAAPPPGTAPPAHQLEEPAIHPTKQRPYDGVGYPARDDAEGWARFIDENGYKEFRDLQKAGFVDESVFESQLFNMSLQDGMQREARKWEMLTTMSKNDYQISESIIQNLRV